MTYDVEVYDPFGLHDNVTNPSRITIPAGWSGVWAMGGQVTWAANGTGQRDAFIRRAMAAGWTEQAIFRREAGSASFSSPLYLSTETYLAEGDYVELWAMQSSGGSLTSQRFTAHSPTFWASYRGT